MAGKVHTTKICEFYFIFNQRVTVSTVVILTAAYMLTLKRNLIGSGSFGHVYKAVKRIEGIFYAVKISKEKISKRTSHKMVQLNKEICALSVLGKSHQNLIRYYSSWIEEDRGIVFQTWSRNPRTRIPGSGPGLRGFGKGYWDTNGVFLNGRKICFICSF